MTQPPDLEVLKDIKAFVAAYPPREPFLPRGEPHTVYMGPHRRWVLQLEETHDIGYGLWRDDMLGEANVYGNDLDSESFASNLCEALSPQLSIHALRDLVKAFTKELNECEARRAAFMAGGSERAALASSKNEQ